MIPSKFHHALLRLPEAERPQYCYTTAAAMPLRKFPLAKALIEYSLELEGSWLDRMRAHHNLADLYERREDFQNAAAHYRLALEAVPEELQEKYAPDYAAHLLVCQLHLDDFAYSDELRRLFDCCRDDSDFRQQLLKPQFYRTLARLLLSLQDGDSSAALAAYEQATAMLRPGHRGPLTALLRRKGYFESTGATTQARAFLNKIQHQLP